MYLLIPFPEIQEYQELEGFEDHSQPSVDEDGSCFVEASWIMEKDESKAITLIKESFSDMPFSERDIHIIESEMEQTIPFEGGMTTREALIQIYYNQL